MISGSCHCRAVTWTFDATPEGATACNCTVCRRYGSIWIFGDEDATISHSGSTSVYHRQRAIEFHFCPTCGCLTWWRGRRPEPDGRRRMAVNLRLADDPDSVMQIPFYHFDGLDTFEDLPRDGKRVADMWF